MFEEFVDTLYENGDQILYQFFGDEDFGSARYRVVNAIMFLFYEPAIVLWSVAGCVMLALKSRRLNNVMLCGNGVLLMAGALLMAGLLCPAVAGSWFDGEWIAALEERMRDFYLWVDRNVVWGVARLLHCSYKMANIVLFVFAVPGLVMVMNGVMLLVNRKCRGWCWWWNCGWFAACVLIGITIVVMFGLNL